MRCIILNLLLFADLAGATQSHGDPEGQYVHQFSHIFFIFSMSILIYWLRSRQLTREIGWGFIQFASVFFIFWSLDAFLAHYLDEQTAYIRATQVDAWHIHVQAENTLLIFFYYAVKLDHIILVPAIVLLYLGVKRLSERCPAPCVSTETGEPGR